MAILTGQTIDAGVSFTNAVYLSGGTWYKASSSNNPEGVYVGSNTVNTSGFYSVDVAKTITFRHDLTTTTLSIPSQLMISGTNDVDIFCDVRPEKDFGNVNKGACSSVYTLRVENIDTISRDVTGITAPTGFSVKKAEDSTWLSSIPSFTLTSGSHQDIDFMACTTIVGDVSEEATLSYNPTLSILLSVTSIANEFAVTLIDDYVDRASNRLIRQYKQGSNVQDVLEAFVTPFQQSENDAYELYSMYDIDTMEGVNLDKIGASIGQTRSGYADAEYRILLKGKIAINNSRGTLNDIISTWNIFNPNETIEVIEQFPGQIELKTTLVRATQQQEDLVFNLMKQAKLAGVRLLGISPIINTGDGYLLLDSTDSLDWLDAGIMMEYLNS